MMILNCSIILLCILPIAVFVLSFIDYIFSHDKTFLSSLKETTITFRNIFLYIILGVAFLFIQYGIIEPIFGGNWEVSSFIFSLLLLLVMFIFFVCKNSEFRKKLIKKMPVWLIKFYIMAAGYTLIFIEKYKKDWFKYTLLILLALIAIALLKIAF